MSLKMSSAKWHPFCLGLNVLTIFPVIQSLPELPIGVLNVQYINNMKDLLKNEIGPIDFPDVIQHPI